MFKSFMRKFVRNEDGVAMTEYLLLLGGLALAAAIFIGFFGDTLEEQLVASCNAIFGAGTCAAAG